MSAAPVEAGPHGDGLASASIDEKTAWLIALQFYRAAVQVKKLQEQVLKPKEQVTLEPYERDHAMVVGVYRPPPKKK